MSDSKSAFGPRAPSTIYFRKNEFECILLHLVNVRMMVEGALGPQACQANFKLDTSPTSLVYRYPLRMQLDVGK